MQMLGLSEWSASTLLNLDGIMLHADIPLLEHLWVGALSIYLNRDNSGYTQNHHSPPRLAPSMSLRPCEL